MRTKDQVLNLILEGLSNRDIADKACITEGAVKYHISNLFKQYKVDNRIKLMIAVKEERSKSLDQSINKDQDQCPVVQSFKDRNNAL